MTCLLAQGISLIIPSFLLIGSAFSVLQLYVGLFMYAISSATVVPCITTLASSFGPKEHKGATLGVFRSIGALARALGPLIACAGELLSPLLRPSITSHAS